MRRVARRTALFSLAFAIAGALGCLSPTLPLPPPNEPEVEPPDEHGNVRLYGHVLPQAHAMALNTRTGQFAGEQTGETGYYDFVIEGQVGDRLEFFYLLGTDQSGPKTVIVPEPEDAP